MFLAFGTERAEIELELYRHAGRNTVIRRTFGSKGKCAYRVDGKEKREPEVRRRPAGRGVCEAHGGPP